MYVTLLVFVFSPYFHPFGHLPITAGPKAEILLSDRPKVEMFSQN